MVVIKCSKADCSWQTPDRNEALAAVLAAELANHTAVAHSKPTNESTENGQKKAPAIERPKLSAGGTEETWAVFLKKMGTVQNRLKNSSLPTEQPFIPMLCGFIGG